MGNKKQSDRKKKKERKKDVLIGALMTQNIQLIDKNKEMKKKKLKSRVRRGNENIKSPDGECKNEDEGIRGTIECKQRREEVNGAKKPRIKWEKESQRDHQERQIKETTTQSKEKKKENKKRDERKNVKDGGLKERTKNCKVKFDGSGKRSWGMRNIGSLWRCTDKAMHSGQQTTGWLLIK